MDKAMPISASRIEPNFTTGLMPDSRLRKPRHKGRSKPSLKKKQFLTMTKLCLISVVRTW